MFVLSTNHKGAIAEIKIAAAAVEMGVPVLRPEQEHLRYDLAFDLGDRIARIQCKWGALDREQGVIKVNLESSWFSPQGYVRRGYRQDEIDAIAVYCADLDECFLLHASALAGRRALHLRVDPVKNGQRACVNLAADFAFKGAVAQLAERRRGTPEAGGSSPPSSTLEAAERAVAVQVGCHEFRNHFGYYLEQAAAGTDIEVSRRGKPYARLIAAETPRPPIALVRSA